ncbi:hypothetical protein CVT24_003918, partial [Panaeolus cyanescens]
TVGLGTNHLLGRRLQRRFDGDEHDDFSDEDRNSVCIVNDKIYQVGTCRINFTTYDNRRDYDIINPKSHPDVMVLSQQDDKDVRPFWYARVLGVYHAKVSTTHPEAHSKSSERMHFLFVRWFGSEPSHKFGFRNATLPKIGFVEDCPDYDNCAFGFLDPAQIIRGCHLIPVFCGGTSNSLLPFECPVARQIYESKTTDWVNYYVNIFVDRDMVMRHYGGGVGHQDMHIRRQEDLLGISVEDSWPDLEQEDRAEGPENQDQEAGGEPPVAGEQEEQEESEVESSEDDGWDSDENDEDDDGHYASD